MEIQFSRIRPTTVARIEVKKNVGCDDLYSINALNADGTYIDNIISCDYATLEALVMACAKAVATGGKQVPVAK